MERNQSHRTAAFLVTDSFARTNLTRFATAVASHFSCIRVGGAGLILDEFNPSWVRQSAWMDEAGFQFRCCLPRGELNFEKFSTRLNEVIACLNKEFTECGGPTIRYFREPHSDEYAEVTYITSRTSIGD